MKHKILSVCSMLLALPSVVLSQEHLTPNPPCIIVRPDGAYEIRLDAGNEPAHHEAVPVYWEASDGSLNAEKTYSGVSSDGLGGHSARVPLYLVRRADGTWVVEEGIWAVFHGPRGYWETDIPGSGRVFVRDLNAPALPRPDPAQALKARGGINILHAYDDFGRPGYLDEPTVARAVSNAVATINELLGDDYAPALVEFVWVDFSSVPGKENTLAIANTTLQSRSLNIIANSIEAFYTSNDTDSFETGLQNSAPLPNVSYKSNLGDDNTTNSAWVSVIQASKLFLIPQPTQVIEINSAEDNWDPDPSDGIGAGRYDMTGAFVHELIHLLGFASFTENPDLALDGPITQWDTFRFNASDQSVTSSEFTGGDRELRSSQAAVGVLQLNSAFNLIPSVARVIGRGRRRQAGVSLAR